MSATTGTAIEQARRGFLARFEDEIDPDRTMGSEERETRARRLMRAYMIQLSHRSRIKRSKLGNAR